jgi:hypothetical protein
MLLSDFNPIMWSLNREPTLLVLLAPLQNGYEAYIFDIDGIERRKAALDSDSTIAVRWRTS